MAELFLLNEMFGGPSFHRRPSASSSALSNHADVRYAHQAASLPVDFLEKGNMYEVHADLPGYKKEDIEVNIDDGVLSLEATREAVKTEKSDDKDGETSKYYHQERHSSKVYRAFRLPANASRDDATVTYVDGVLKVVIPRVEKAGAKKLAIA